MIVYGEAVEDGRIESFVETDEFSNGGDNFYIRVTALHPYKDYAAGSDELLAHIDFRNEATGATGRFERIMIPARQQQDNNLRRGSVFRALPSLIAQLTPVPSPVLF